MGGISYDKWDALDSDEEDGAPRPKAKAAVRKQASFATAPEELAAAAEEARRAEAEGERLQERLDRLLERQSQALQYRSDESDQSESDGEEGGGHRGGGATASSSSSVAAATAANVTAQRPVPEAAAPGVEEQPAPSSKRRGLDRIWESEAEREFEAGQNAAAPDGGRGEAIAGELRRSGAAAVEEGAAQTPDAPSGGGAGAELPPGSPVGGNAAAALGGEPKASTLRRVKQLDPTVASAIEQECGVSLNKTDIFRLVLENPGSRLKRQTRVLIVMAGDSFLCQAPDSAGSVLEVATDAAASGATAPASPDSTCGPGALDGAGSLVGASSPPQSPAAAAPHGTGSAADAAPPVHLPAPAAPDSAGIAADVAPAEQLLAAAEEEPAAAGAAGSAPGGEATTAAVIGASDAVITHGATLPAEVLPAGSLPADAAAASELAATPAVASGGAVETAAADAATDGGGANSTLPDVNPSLSAAEADSEVVDVMAADAIGDRDEADGSVVAGVVLCGAATGGPSMTVEASVGTDGATAANAAMEGGGAGDGIALGVASHAATVNEPSVTVAAAAGVGAAADDTGAGGDETSGRAAPAEASAGGFVEAELCFFRAKPRRGALRQKLGTVPTLHITLETDEGLHQSMEFVGVHQRQYCAEETPGDAISQNLEESLLKVVLEFVFHPSRSRYARERLVIRECSTTAEARDTYGAQLPRMIEKVQRMNDKIRHTRIEFCERKVCPHRPDKKKDRSFLILDEDVLKVAPAKKSMAKAPPAKAAFKGLAQGFLNKPAAKARGLSRPEPPKLEPFSAADEAAAPEVTSPAPAASSPAMRATPASSSSSTDPAAAASTSGVGASSSSPAAADDIRPGEQTRINPLSEPDGPGPVQTDAAERRNLLLPGAVVQSGMSEDVRAFARQAPHGSAAAASRRCPAAVPEEEDEDEAHGGDQVASLSELANQLFGDLARHPEIEITSDEPGVDDVTESTKTPSPKAASSRDGGAPSERSDLQVEGVVDAGDGSRRSPTAATGIRLLQQRRRERGGAQQEEVRDESDELVRLWMKQRW